MTTTLSGQTRGIRRFGEMALIFRVFSLIVIDRPDLCSAGWISVLIGGALSLPVVLIDRLRKNGANQSGAEALSQNGWTASAGGALMTCLMIYDAAASARLLTEMAAAVALLNFPLIALLLPAMIVVLLVALMGAGTMGSAAVVWSKIAFWLCAVLLAVLLWRLEPDWLAPLLGPGIGTLLCGSEYAAGYMAASMLSTFVMSGQAFRSRAGLAGSLMRAVVICAAAVILFSMVIPAMPQLIQTRMFRIGLLMDNGRTSLSLEIIYAFLMYGGMILAVGFDVMSASAFMRMALGKMPGWLCACVCSAAATAVALLGWAEQETMRVLAAWYYPATALACALCAIRLKRKEEPI